MLFSREKCRRPFFRCVKEAFRLIILVLVQRAVSQGIKPWFPTQHFCSPVYVETKRLVLHKPQFFFLSRLKRAPPPPPHGKQWLVAFPDKVSSVSCFVYSTQRPTRKMLLTEHLKVSASQLREAPAAQNSKYSSQSWSVKRGRPGTGTYHGGIANSAQHSPTNHTALAFSRFIAAAPIDSKGSLDCSDLHNAVQLPQPQHRLL